MSPTKVYAGSVVEVNGSSSGPFQPGPSSGFVYTIDVTMDDAVRRVTGIKPPAANRWPDSFDMHPLNIGEVVFVYRVGDKLLLKDTEHVPAVEACP